MSRIAYVDGVYARFDQAAVHVEDRGFQFSDGVYEVCAVNDGLLLDEVGHLDRLDRSLRELRISAPVSRNALGVILREVARRNRVRDGLVYLQVTRGVAPRNHAFPNPPVKPTLIVTARSHDQSARDASAAKGGKVITMPDLRWKRRDIKSVSLLPNVLAKQAAAEQGAIEAWLIDDAGYVTEGASSNAWIVTARDELITRPVSNEILRGVTRQGVVRLAEQQGVKFIQRQFTVQEAYEAREAFITAASAFVTPVTRIDDKLIHGGEPGPVSAAFRTAYRERASAEAQ
ncbi:MAG: D-amino-acid transaminase [Pseudomonadota bacterium]